MRSLILTLYLVLASFVAGPAPTLAEPHLTATPAGFANVLSKANPGSVIHLAPGDYGHLAGRGLGGAPGAPLVLRATDPAKPPRFARMDLRAPKHLVLDGLVFDYRFAEGDPIHLRPFQIVGGTDIILRGLLFEGDDARGRSQIDDGSPTGFGLALTDMQSATIEASKIRGFFRGLVVAKSQDVVVRGNELHSLRMDGMNFAQVERVEITGNTIRDFRRVLDSSDHADMIQFWTAKTFQPSRDILISGNILNSGQGLYTQTIFMRNEEVDNKRAGLEMFYRNITIEKNLIINAHTHGITVGETKGLLIRNNTLLRNPQSEGKTRNLNLWTPMIRVAPDARSVRIEANAVANIVGYSKQGDWSLINNFVIQDRTRLSAGFYEAVLNGSLQDISSLSWRKGTVLSSGKIGAPWPTHPQNTK